MPAGARLSLAALKWLILPGAGGGRSRILRSRIGADHVGVVQVAETLAGRTGRKALQGIIRRNWLLRADNHRVAVNGRELTGAAGPAANRRGAGRDDRGSERRQIAGANQLRRRRPRPEQRKRGDKNRGGAPRWQFADKRRFHFFIPGPIGQATAVPTPACGGARSIKNNFSRLAPPRPRNGRRALPAAVQPAATIIFAGITTRVAAPTAVIRRPTRSAPER